MTKKTPDLVELRCKRCGMVAWWCVGNRTCFNISEKFQVALSRSRKESFSRPSNRCIVRLVFCSRVPRWLRLVEAYYNEVKGIKLSDEGLFEEGAWPQLLFFSGWFLMFFLLVLARYRKQEIQVILVMFRCYGNCIASSLVKSSGCSKRRRINIVIPCRGLSLALVI
ncbi:uncharacterized protein LOC130512807 [Raphanus sativus]|uniref:Uncharacterized protein LOC130512807 n=1 Tax=Raphanus sativus TaxID=3726 RepID=A0A9W3DTG0_RAPSA|nr:uncharacterized protein LOC130512807 [Raphanus sativus]